MAIKVNETVTINRPVKDVKEYVANLENEPNYWEGVENVKLLAGSHGQVGAKYERTFTAMGRKQTTTMEVVEFAANKVVVQSLPGPVTVRGTMLFESVLDGTKLDLTIDAQAHGFARLFAGKIGKGMRENTRTSLGRLKVVLERAKDPVKAGAAKPSGKATKAPARKK